MDATSSPSRIPLVPEILKLICEELIPHKSALASFARTCTKTEGPALDVLWYDIQGLHPLIKCLPSNLWAEEERGKAIHLVLKHPIIFQTHCSRLMHYAEKIRRFSNKNPKNVKTKVHPSLCVGLQAALQGGKLLPNVQFLMWNCSTLKAPYIFLFLGPRIIDINLTISASSPDELSLVPALLNQYPLLKNFDFSFYGIFGSSVPGYMEGIELISCSLYSCNNLEVLDVPELTHSGLLALSSLPHLKPLSVWNCDNGIFAIKNKTRQKDVGFPGLQNLRLQHFQSMSDCIVLLETMNRSPIVTLEIAGLVGIQTLSSWKMLFLAINRHCHHDSLEDLNCWDGDGISVVTTRPRGDMADAKILEPLLEFTNIKQLNIGIARELFFSDASITLKRIVTGWKNITVLTLETGSFSRCEEPSSLTLSDLIYVAENCPALEILGLNIDARNPPRNDILDEFFSTTIRDSAVTHLVVGDSPVGDPALVSAFLSGIFPKLNRINTVEDSEGDGDSDSINHKAWKEVQRLLEVFSSVRKQERSHAIRYTGKGRG